jgi:membrane complex biogenesis BtpA family protein
VAAPIKLVGTRQTLVGVVHLAPLPGAPRYAGDMGSLVERAVADARALAAGGCDALIVENFGDTPFFPDQVPAETVAGMALALHAVIDAAEGTAVGVNVLRNDARAALGLCAATGASFVRINVHTGAAVSDQGLLQGRAAETVRERERLCPDVRLLCDVHVKHAAPLGRPDIAEAAADTARRGLADALIVTGAATGAAPHAQELRRVREAAPSTPVLIGSGLTESNAAELLAGAAGAIVGTFFKKDGDVRNPVDGMRVSRLRAAIDAL